MKNYVIMYLIETNQKILITFTAWYFEKPGRLFNLKINLHNDSIGKSCKTNFLL